MRSPFLLLLAIYCLVIVACGGDDSDSTRSPTATRNFEASAQDLVPAVPLTLDDVPRGWEEAGEDEQDLTGSVELPAGCNIFDPNVAFPGAVVTATGPRLRGPLGQQVTSYAAIYRGADQAQQTVDATRDILDRCANDFKSAVEDIADEQLSALGIHLGFLADINVTLVEQPIATGDGAAFYRLQAKISLPGDDMTFTLDARVIREGRVVAALTYYAQGEGDTEAEANITTTLLASAARADGALPE